MKVMTGGSVSVFSAMSAVLSLSVCFWSAFGLKFAVAIPAISASATTIEPQITTFFFLAFYDILIKFDMGSCDRYWSV